MDERDIRRVANGGDVGVEVPRQLNGRCADRPRGAVDDELLACLQAGAPQAEQRRERAVRNRGRLREAQALGHLREDAPLHPADVSACPRALGPHVPKTRWPTVNCVTELPTASISPAISFPRIRCFGRSSPAKNRQSQGRAARRWQSVRLTVGCVDPDEHLVVARHRPLHVLESKHLRAAVPVVDDRSQALTSHVGEDDGRWFWSS